MDQIEAATGLDFFNGLPVELEADLEGSVDAGWCIEGRAPLSEKVRAWTLAIIFSIDGRKGTSVPRQMREEHLR